jgi:uncharacterized protein (TIGR03437 family)
LSSYYGTFQATTGTIIGHQRLLTGFDGILNDYTAFDYTYSDTFAVHSDATMDDFLGLHHVVGAGGDIRIGIGTGLNPGLNVALRAQALTTGTGSGVFLNPTGAVNWFSSAPFSVGVSPGVFMALSGTGLSNVSLTDPTMPFNLGNVQVLVNDRASPIYRVSPNLIIIVIPYATSGSVASIKVISNGVGSNTITVFASNTTPGVLAANGGAGNVIAQHLDFSLVTTDHPAMPGEIILFYVDGLGKVNPALADGVPAPLPPAGALSTVVANLAAIVGGKPATILFKGLTPTLIADYAFIVVIPPTTAAGNVFVDVSGPDSFTSIATVPVGGGTATQIATEVTTADVVVRGPRAAMTVPDTVQETVGPSVETPWGSTVPVRRVDNGGAVR